MKLTERDKSSEEKEREIAKCCCTELKETTETALGVHDKVKAYVEIKIISFSFL